MTETRKPTGPQLATLHRAIDVNEGVVFPSTARRGILERLQSYGWVTAGQRDTGSDENGQLWLEYPRVTDDGRRVARRVHTIAITDAGVGGTLVYRSHPGCAIKIVEVIDGGRSFRAEYVTMCGVCLDKRDGGLAQGFAPRHPGEILRHHAYLLRRETAAERDARRERARARVQPTEQTHEFVTGSSTGLCWQQVDRPNGSVAPCAEPINSPIHNPAAYLEYATALGTELKKWANGEGEYADLVHPFTD